MRVVGVAEVPFHEGAGEFRGIAIAPVCSAEADAERNFRSGLIDREARTPDEVTALKQGFPLAEAAALLTGDVIREMPLGVAPCLDNLVRGEESVHRWIMVQRHEIGQVRWLKRAKAQSFGL